MTGTFPVEAGWVVFSRDGRAQFGWRDPETGSFHAEADGECIADAVGAVEFYSEVVH
ncbi:hypothetical protein [Paraburkholderia domus]|uniref:hypothetical protein n=1 Tax=Paraburkholderia domus TaxID=2793075 RepID=UPI001911ECFB|nr:hypothetical protein [Paraburkholderia domus]MBK5065725.1 hypothetical protein [Burkholderia sp. R-70199]CAE6962241.1 hypothetical protein R70199_07407 [Paraburkholderia domus]